MTILSNRGNAITNDKGSVTFLCPSCGKGKIIRTLNERQNVSEYICSDCGFRGPN